MSTLPIKLSKRISGRCCYSGCAEPAIDGSDFCAPHDAHERGRDAGKKRRQRQRLADAGVCTVAGCGKKVGKRKRADGTVQQRRCAACKKARRPKPGVPAMSTGVPGDSADPRWRPDFNPKTGQPWLRFRGKGRRGRLTREEQIDEKIRDVEIAEAELVKLKRALEQLKHPDVINLPVIQREAAQRQVALFVGLPSRILDEVAEWCG